MNDPPRPPPLLPGRRRSSAPGLLTRIVAIAVGALALVGAVAISFVVFVIVLAALLVIGLYVWWKSRHFRRQLREQLNAQRAGTPRGDIPQGDIIEGEVISRKESDPPRN